MPHKLDLRFNELIRGLTTPIRALKLIFKYPRLIFFSSFPIMVTIIVSALCIYAVLTGAWSLGMAWFQNIAGSYAGVASGILAFLFGIFTLYLMFHSVGISLSLIASPFNDMLAEETERVCGQSPCKLTLSTFVHIFFLDLRKTVLTLSLSLGLWFLALVPVVGLLSPLGFSLITTLTFISYPQSRRHLGIIECLVWMRNHSMASLGFGFSTMVLFGIPVLNAFALPISVVGGTLLFLENE